VTSIVQISATPSNASVIQIKITQATNVWDKAVTLTQRHWHNDLLKTFTGTAVDATVHSHSILSQSANCESQQKLLKKAFFSVLPGITKGELAQLFVSIKDIKDERERKAVKLAVARGTTANLPHGNAKAKRRRHI